MRRAVGSASLAVVLWGGTTASAQWEAGGWRAERLGIFDAVHTRSDGQQQSLLAGERVELDGMYVGISERYGGPNYVGRTAWVSTRSVPFTRVGFFDSVHTGTNGEQDSSLGVLISRAGSTTGGVNARGEVVGVSSRFVGDGIVGETAWIWSAAQGTRRIGPFTGVFVDGLLQNSAPVALADTGLVGGFATRYDTSNPSSRSAWVWREDLGTQIVGLVDAVHTRDGDNTQRHFVRWMNNSGLVAGVSDRFDVDSPFTVFGQSSWVWTEAEGSVRVGLVGPSPRYRRFDGYEYAYIYPPREGGEVLGASETFNPEWQDDGRDAWITRGSIAGTLRLGLTDAEHTDAQGLQRSEPTAYTRSGPLVVSGYSSRYDPNAFGFAGRSAWAWTPSLGTSVKIGLLDAEHTGAFGQRDAFPFFVAGESSLVGLSRRFAGGFVPLGDSIWVWTSPTPSAPQGATRRLGLSDALHTSTEGVQRTEFYGSTRSGKVVGVSYRYNGRPNQDISVGRTAWIYDIPTSTQTTLAFNFSTSGDSLTLPLYVSEDGVVTGYYLEYAGTQIVAQRAFAWSQERGLTTINDLLQGGPLANDMENAFFGAGIDLASGSGALYAMPPGVIWTPAGIDSFATAYRLTRLGTSPTCDSVDFNNDQVFPDDQDIADFVRVLGGGDCATCNDVDFNNDGVFPDDADLATFLIVLGGGNCG